MSKLEELLNTIKYSGETEANIIKDTKDLLKRIKESGLTDRDKTKAIAYINEFSKSMLKPDTITDRHLTDEETEGARLLRVHNKGYIPGQYTLDTDAMKPYLDAELKYRNGTSRSLRSVYGDIDSNLSNEAFSVYSKNGEKPTVVFRGSKTSPKDLKFFDDWKYNVEAIHNPANARKQESIIKIEEALDTVKQKYGGFSKMIGYSKGGNHAIYYGTREGVPVDAYNPHITFEHDLTNLKAPVKIMRTPLDPASLLLSIKNKGLGKELKIKTIPPLEHNSDPIGAHSDDNFWDDQTPRNRFNELQTKLKANLSMRKLETELLEVEKAKSSTNFKSYLTKLNAEASQDQVDAEVRKITLKQSRIPKVRKNIIDIEAENIKNNPQEYNEALQKAVNIYSEVDTNQDRIDEIRNFAKKYGIEKVRVLRSRIANRVNELGSVSPEKLDEIYASEKAKFLNQLGEPFKIGRNTRAYLSANQDIELSPLEARLAMNEDVSNPSEFSSEIADTYARMSPTERLNTLRNLRSRINNSTNGIYDDYISPINKSVRSTFNQQLRVGSGVAFRGIRGAAGGLLLGSAISGGIQSIADALHLDKDMNPYVEQALIGTSAGGLTETASMALTQTLVRTATTGLKIGTSALSGGVGIVIGSLATNAIENAFSKSANPYIKDITSNIIGSEIGFAAGAATAAGIGATVAGLGTATAAEGAIAGADWWNPIGWGAAIGAIATAIGGGIAGGIQASQEEKAKQLMAQEKTEATYAGKAAQLREQYNYIRTFITEMGIAPSVVGTLNTKMIAELQNPNAAPMNSNTFQQTFKHYLNQYSLNNFRYSAGIPSAKTDLQNTLEAQYTSHQSVLDSLVNQLNAAGANLQKPTPQLYDAQSFSIAYNNILNKVPNSIINKAGVKPMGIPGDAPEPDLTSSIPGNMDADRTAGYENSIIAQAQKQERESTTSQRFNTVPVTQLQPIPTGSSTGSSTGGSTGSST